MFDVFVYYIKNETDQLPTYLVEIDSSKVNDAIKFLNMFKIKRNVS